jgi:hypothetical protein
MLLHLTSQDGGLVLIVLLAGVGIGWAARALLREWRSRNRPR